MNITLENLHLATPQQVFNQAVSRLLEQGEHSHHQRNPDNTGIGVCMYRQCNDGKVLACAAGHLMSTREAQKLGYFTDTEGWGMVVERTGINAHHDLIVNLQGVHDSQDVVSWRDSFRHVAMLHGLDDSVTYAR